MSRIGLTARGLAKSYGERLRGCNVRTMNPVKAEALSPELQAALEPLLAALESVSQQIRESLGEEKNPALPARAVIIFSMCVEVMEFAPAKDPCCHPYSADHPKP